MNGECCCGECRDEAALYALNSLTPEQRRAFDLRLQGGCPLCTAQVSEYAQAAELLAMAVAPVEPPPALRQRLLGRIAAGGSIVPDEPTGTVVRGDTPFAPTPIAGVETRPLFGHQTMLVRMQPGATYPEHEHHQNEQCFVMEGSIVDGNGITLQAGDFINMPPGSVHSPVHTETGCVFLIAYTD